MKKASNKTTTPTTPDEFTVDQMADRINKAHKACAVQILEVAKLVVEAATRFNDEPALNELLEKLSFDDSTWSKYLKIGRDERLHEPDLELPASRSTLYGLCFLDEEAWCALRTEGKLNGKLTQAALEAWKDARAKSGLQARIEGADAASTPNDAVPTADKNAKLGTKPSEATQEHVEAPTEPETGSKAQSRSSKTVTKPESKAESSGKSSPSRRDKSALLYEIRSLKELSKDEIDELKSALESLTRDWEGKIELVSIKS